MSVTQRTAALGVGPRGARRKAQTSELIVKSFLPGREERMPLIVTPAVDNVDLAAWCESHRDELYGYYDTYGAILFRGFPLADPRDFESVAASIVEGELFADYGDLPPEPGARIYGTTPYPEDKWILFHNESSHLNKWPLHQFFFVVIPPVDRGTTPLLDCREVYRRLDPELRAIFEEKGLLYVRNFSDGIDVPWQDFFHTDDRAEVERQCAAAGMTCEWRETGLRLNQPSAAVRTHPRTGEKLFFNQIQLHHVACLDPETRAALGELFDEEDMPRNVYYGDGTRIPDEVVAYITTLYEELCVDFTWQKGDLAAVDNMIISHARRPYSGARRLLVAMGDMVHA
jgi:alpha-ketoglutarate-dependent taurine dioxygenase